MPNKLPETQRSLARDRVARHRAGKHRIDYAPAPDVLAWIDQVMADSPPGFSRRQILDHLLREAQKVLA
jgi:hypothetical protein